MTTINVLVVSDTICPWCYIGYKELKLAMEAVTKDNPTVQFNLEYQPFLLDPTLSCKHPVDKNEHLVKKFGEARFSTACKFLDQRGKELGINFNFSGKLRQTVSSHRLLLYAYQKEPALQEVLVVKLFQAYFEQARDIGCPSVLGELAEESGVMTKDETLEFLKSDKLVDEIRTLMMDAHRKGITGVPFTVINQKYAVTGAQRAEAYVEVFNKLITSGDVLETETEIKLEACKISTAPSREICT